ncbi:MAG: hypothetical protein N4A41_00500 [Crocinitomicaceae bacterium]|jgi:hypothetical protein|nr:hypothetical protein [Crocinitomicaceae bacterium]
MNWIGKIFKRKKLPTQRFKEPSSTTRRNQYQFNVELRYWDKPIKEFTAAERANTKKEAFRKLQEGLSLRVAEGHMIKVKQQQKK